MRKHHPENERIKRRYVIFLREAKRLSEASVDQVAAALADFEDHTGYRDFKRFHIEQARAYKRALGGRVSQSTGKPLAKATIHSRLMALKAFVQWLSEQPGYRSRISYADAEYFNPSANDGRIAKASTPRPVPSLEQVKTVIAAMPDATAIERRDRALIAFAILTGARDNAIASLKLKHLDIEKRTVCQDAREVRTKRAKSFTSCFFPVGEDIVTIFVDWVNELRSRHQFGPDDPLFPKTQVIAINGLFTPDGLLKEHWRDAAPIRRIFRDAFTTANLPYFNPHSFRHTLAALGERLCTSAESFKAWSQNLGHEHVLTTFTSYGGVSLDRQTEIIGALGQTPDSDFGDGPPSPQTVQRVLDHLREQV
jgi:integrase